MKYILDGYNILFLYVDPSRSFSKERDSLIASLQNQFKQAHLSGLLVFDGAHRREEESGRSYASPLEIIYTPKGQNADSYILEKAKRAQNPKEVTIVSNDQGLARQAKSAKIHVQSIQTFFRFLEKKLQKTPTEKQTKDSPRNIERLLNIFLSKLE